MALTKITGQVINDTTGLVVGVTTVGGGISATDGFFSGIVTAVGDASFSGNVSVGGTLTYEDVTNIDAVGLVTARNGIVVGSGITLSKDGDIFATGITTISENLKVGTGVTISPDGDGFFTGVVTATTFKGDGSQLSNVTSTTINSNADNRLITGSGTANTLNGESGATYDGTDFIVSSGRLKLTDESSGDQIRIGAAGDFTIEHDGSNTYLKNTTGDLLVQNDANVKITAKTGGTERLRIGSSGQIGIAGANYGTSGQVLQSQGSGSAVQWATPTAWVYGTAADYDQWGSTTDVEFSGWPSTWQEIRVSFIDVSVTNNAYMQFFVSKSSSTAARITSGYQNTSGQFGNNNNASVDTATNMGRFSGTGASNYSMTGYVSFYKFSGTKIRYKGDLTDKTYGNYLYSVTGYVVCDPTSSMTHLFFRGQGYSYDAGQFKLDYLGS